MKTALFVVFTLLTGWVSRAQTLPTEDGLYAVFDTSMGKFVCRLEYQLVPRVVASFVGLAEGTKPWLDYAKAQVVQRPFYTGLTFHRVSPGFVIQSGSPNGMGTDDPGYLFNDQFSSSISHNKAGILSMANATNNANGSQFFVTLNAATYLDNHYSAFGQVVSGMDVVQAIGAVPVVNEKPTNTVTMNGVSILRLGRQAVAFNPATVTPPLPDPAVTGVRLVDMDGLVAEWNQQTNSDYRLCYSTDLISWDGYNVGPYKGAYLDLFLAVFPHQAFFRVFETKADQQ
jgi:peptidylprolyl isomerase